MRSKAPLALVEQTLMILVFALAAALCLQAFVRADRLSREVSSQRQIVKHLCHTECSITHEG